MNKLLLMGLAGATLAAQVARADGGWNHGGGHDGGHHDGGHNGSYYTPHYEPHGHEVHDLPYDYCRLFLGGLEFFYAEGLYYRRAADHYVVVTAPVGAVVTTIPSGCPPIIVEGTPYYTINGVTYMQSGYGYQVVPPPRVVVVNNPVPVAPLVVSAPVESTSVTAGTSAADGGDTFTVNIPNSKGGYTPVVVKRSGNGFVGPQGEFYTDFPRVDQLKVMYGK